MAVKVPKSVAGCRFDGFDVAAWVDQATGGLGYLSGTA